LDTDLFFALLGNHYSDDFLGDKVEKHYVEYTRPVKESKPTIELSSGIGFQTAV
jgi:hypothetical protein